ncbi:HI1506-related protein [Ectopseudomonas chengduensis]
MIVRIKSKRDGYRRCGISHPRLATDHPAERFTESMLAKLQADPVLTVELIDGVDTEPAKAKPGAKPTSAKPAAKPATQAKG